MGWPTVGIGILLCLGASSCERECTPNNDCIGPNQCAPENRRYAIDSNHYKISQSTVQSDSCMSERRSGDWDGLGVDLVADQAKETVSIGVANGVDLGSGTREQAPNCNTAFLERDALSQSVGGCLFNAKQNTKITIRSDGGIDLSVTETRSGFSGSCTIAPNSCALQYDATIRLDGNS